jgi:hypothetical protein
MSKLSYVAGAITVLGLLASGATAAPLSDDQVDVTFKEAPGDRFVAVINLVMGTETAKKVNANHYLFRVGPQGTQNDYAVFFAHLPYVKGVAPLPKLSAAERELPNVVINVDPATRGLPTARPTSNAAKGYVPGQLLVKPKANVSASAVAEFNRSLGITGQDAIEGVDVLVMHLPSNLSVEAAQKAYNGSGLFEYANPNRVMGVGDATSADPNVPDNYGQGIYVTPQQIVGTTLLVNFRSDGPTAELINQVYGTRSLERTDSDQTRLALPGTMNPLVAARIFRLCPWVLQAEPAYGR